MKGSQASHPHLTWQAARAPAEIQAASLQATFVVALRLTRDAVRFCHAAQAARLLQQEFCQSKQAATCKHAEQRLTCAGHLRGGLPADQGRSALLPRSAGSHAAAPVVFRGVQVLSAPGPGLGRPAPSGRAAHGHGSSRVVQLPVRPVSCCIWRRCLLLIERSVGMWAACSLCHQAARPSTAQQCNAHLPEVAS